MILVTLKILYFSTVYIQYCELRHCEMYASNFNLYILNETAGKFRY
jgi:hypothetical protein